MISLYLKLNPFSSNLIGRTSCELVKTEAIIRSMTKKERKNHQIINTSRRARIAAGSGTAIGDVNRVLKSYSEMLKMMKKFRGKPGAITGVKRRKMPKGMKRR